MTTMKCIHCGLENSSGRYCRGCGRPLRDPIEERAKLLLNRSSMAFGDAILKEIDVFLQRLDLTPMEDGFFFDEPDEVPKVDLKEHLEEDGIFFIEEENIHVAVPNKWLSFLVFLGDVFTIVFFPILTAIFLISRLDVRDFSMAAEIYWAVSFPMWILLISLPLYFFSALPFSFLRGFLVVKGVNELLKGNLWESLRFGVVMGLYYSVLITLVIDFLILIFSDEFTPLIFYFFALYLRKTREVSS